MRPPPGFTGLPPPRSQPLNSHSEQQAAALALGSQPTSPLSPAAPASGVPAVAVPPSPSRPPSPPPPRPPTGAALAAGEGQLTSACLGHRMLVRLGWVAGQGLGRASQGRLVPVREDAKRTAKGKHKLGLATMAEEEDMESSLRRREAARLQTEAVRQVDEREARQRRKRARRIASQPQHGAEQASQQNGGPGVAQGSEEEGEYSEDEEGEEDDNLLFSLDDEESDLLDGNQRTKRQRLRGRDGTPTTAAAASGTDPGADSLGRPFSFRSCRMSGSFRSLSGVQSESLQAVLTAKKASKIHNIVAFK